MPDSDRFFLKKSDMVLIAMLASGSSITDSAEAAKVSERTARRRLDDPEFCHMVNEAQAAMLNEASGVLSASMTEAANTLRALLKSENERTRLVAARSILRLGPEVREKVEFEARLLELEKAGA